MRFFSSFPFKTGNGPGPWTCARPKVVKAHHCQQSKQAGILPAAYKLDIFSPELSLLYKLISGSQRSIGSSIPNILKTKYTLLMPLLTCTRNNSMRHSRRVELNRKADAETILGNEAEESGGTPCPPRAQAMCGSPCHQHSCGAAAVVIGRKSTAPRNGEGALVGGPSVSPSATVTPACVLEFIPKGGGVRRGGFSPQYKTYILPV